VTLLLFGLAMSAPLTLAGWLFGVPGVLGWVLYALVMMLTVSKTQGRA